MKRNYKAPEKYPMPSEDEILIFLAGSIEMGGAEDWQKEVEEFLNENHPQAIVLNPRRVDWDSSWKQDKTNKKFLEQVTWELDGLDNADLIILYLAPDTKSPISLIEFGLHAGNNIVVCCPDGFYRQGNVEIVCDRYDIPYYTNLQELLEEL
jgi:hypothetical protein